MVADKTVLHIARIKNNPSALNATTVYLPLALNYLANALKKDRITVLDFGGACGAHYYEARRIVPQSIVLNWIVVETEQMVRSAISRNLTNEELTFTTQLGDITEPVDLLHSSSTLQYVPAPYHFLQQLIDIDAKGMLFNRMMFHSGVEDVITVQRSMLSANGPGSLPPGYIDKPVRYPHTTLSINKFVTAIINAGYTCISEFEEPSGKLSIGREKILGKGLLFWRTDY